MLASGAFINPLPEAFVLAGDSELEASNTIPITAEVNSAEGDASVAAFNYDIDQDGQLAPIDALMVANTLNDDTATTEQQAMVDLNQDGTLSVEDYQMVVDAITASDTFAVGSGSGNFGAGSVGGSGSGSGSAASGSGPGGMTSGSGGSGAGGSGVSSGGAGSSNVGGSGSGAGNMHPCGFVLGGAGSSTPGPNDGIGDPLPQVTIDPISSTPREFELFTLTGTHSHVTELELCGTSSFLLVDYGGVPALVMYADGTWSAQAMFVDNLNGIDPSVMSIIAIADRGMSTDLATMSVSNSPPTIVGSLSETEIDEGQSTTLTVEVTDWGHFDEHTIEVDWGEGPLESYVLPAGLQAEWSKNSTAMMSYGPRVRTFTLPPHQYKDDNPSVSPQDVYTVKFSVTDDDGASDSKTATVTVNNVDPTVSVSAIGPINEGESFSVSGTVFDPGIQDTHTVILKADLNFDGVFSPNEWFVESLGAGQSVKPFTFSGLGPVVDDGPSPGNGTAFDNMNIVVEVTDDDTGFGGLGVPARVNNVPPTFPSDPDKQPVVDVDIDSNLDVVATVSGSFIDPGTLDHHTVVVKWGDGQEASETLTLGDRSFSLARNFGPLEDFEESLLPLTVNVIDDDLGTAVHTFPCSVSNANGAVAEGEGDNAAHACHTITYTAPTFVFKDTKEYKYMFTAPVTSDVFEMELQKVRSEIETTVFAGYDDIKFPVVPKTLGNKLLYAYTDFALAVKYKSKFEEKDGKCNCDMSEAELAFIPYKLIFYDDGQAEKIHVGGGTVLEGPNNKSDHEDWHVNGPSAAVLGAVPQPAERIGLLPMAQKVKEEQLALLKKYAKVYLNPNSIKVNGGDKQCQKLLKLIAEDGWLGSTGKIDDAGLWHTKSSVGNADYDYNK